MDAHSPAALLTDIRAEQPAVERHSASNAMEDAACPHAIVNLVRVANKADDLQAGHAGKDM